MSKLELDYYYGKEAEQFTFYRLPKAIITDDRFKGVTNNAKLLYGLMLDRMSLSRKRGWLDADNRVFIKYSIANIAEDLNITRNTGASLLKELQDVGLIDMIQQNGKPNIIYVKNFISEAETKSDSNPGNNMDQFKNMTGSRNELVEEDDQSDNLTSSENEPVNNPTQSILLAGNPYDPEQKLDQRKYDGKTGAVVEMVPAQELSTNNNISKNNMNENNPINPSGRAKMDSMEQVEAYMELIKENIEYDIMMSGKNWSDRELFDELYYIICDVVCVPKEYIRIGGDFYPYPLVKSKFLKLTCSHLQYVIMCMRNNTTKINNIKAYLITALYNAPDTMDHFYNAEVMHDLYGAI